MRAVVQRVRQASVMVEGRTVGDIGRGLLVLMGVTHGDGEEEASLLARKIAGLRVFDDEAGKMNLALDEVQGAVLLVSQFTLYGDLRRGRRPNFMDAAAPAQAEPLCERVAALLRGQGCAVQTGVFGAMMEVQLVNDGPVTLWLDTAELAAPRRAR